MSKKATHGRLKSLEIKRTANGISVRHEHEPPKKPAPKSGQAYMTDDYDSRHKEYSFNDHGAAAAHVNDHMAQLFGEADADDDEADGKDEQPPRSPKDVKAAPRFVRR